MLFQRSALCPFLGNCLFTPSPCVDFHANQGVGVICTPLRFCKSGFKITERLLEPSSCDTLMSNFVLEAPLCVSHVSQLFDVERLSVA
jgi:hypothetical protein